ncbi:MAG: 6,7-dimethyl-8-ribityllumazine synthase [Candidatus Jidaibacter sp.]|jgi:6,7-dimethyl-8-ribityllumazine synthase|nr:6,7-dimethyl-8-ribityllumazine synthase [Candidatus Jidaibacter sp.]
MAHILILKAQDNSHFVDAMLRASIDVLYSHDHTYDEIIVPSAKELPLAVNLLSESLNYEAVLCLGIVSDSNLEISSMHYEQIIGSLYDYATYFSFYVGIAVVYASVQDLKVDSVVRYAQTIANDLCVMNNTMRQLNSMNVVRDGRSQKHN